ncbi:T3SS (YopN, CesT) and YbjN peptide-binding chaperone 1 [Asanoa iriomotensis]|uniref:YbjN domain-containing protein n=1 Tax=Asanoa iriomotensis TaxID=234613 RepID=A0ABQ4C0L2_9ACTN|nr:hypothetical protein [Asanoa iriomotensis]GIF56304.1 hypothetical protein Air01nite_23990 [Asanoa iriomotensis]
MTSAQLTSTGDDGFTDAILLDEASTADLRGKVIEAWRDFARALSTMLAELPVGSRVELTLDPTASGTGAAVYSVELQIVSEDAVRALAVGNASLPEGYRLNRGAVADLVALGWSPPGVLPDSGEQFGLHASIKDASRIATTVSRTLRDVYGAPHPAFLVYLVHDAEDEPIPVEPLATARPEIAGNLDLDSAIKTGQAIAARGDQAIAGDDSIALEERVRTVVAALMKSEPEQLKVDSDGDIGIRAGSAMVFVRVRDNPPLVDVFSPVLTEIEPTEQLYVKLSELTNRMPIGRLYCTNDTVWASIPVFGRNFQATHLMLAVQVMTGLADELDDRLHGEFGGKRFFGEGDKPAQRGSQEPKTGMYL